jgi:hypothetical protein
MNTATSSASISACLSIKNGDIVVSFHTNTYGDPSVFGIILAYSVLHNFNISKFIKDNVMISGFIDADWQYDVDLQKKTIMLDDVTYNYNDFFVLCQDKSNSIIVFDNMTINEDSGYIEYDSKNSNKLIY